MERSCTRAYTSALLAAFALAAPAAIGQTPDTPTADARPASVRTLRTQPRSAPGTGGAYAGTGVATVLWWDCTPEYGGQAPDALRQAMSDYLDNFGGGGIFDATYVSSQNPGALAGHLAGNSYDVIVFDATGPTTFDAADLAAVTQHYTDHPNMLMDGILYIRSINYDTTTIFPGINGSTGGFTANEVWQLADRGGGIMVGTDHDCCQAGANAIMSATIPAALFFGYTTPSLDGQFNGDDLLEAIASVSPFDLFEHWASVPSEAETPVGMFTDINGAAVELFSQVEVADTPGGPLRPYISTTWEPEGDGPAFDCNNNGVLDSVDIMNGTSLDVNLNLVPDECEVISTQYCNPNVVNSTGNPAGIIALGSDVAFDEDVQLTAYDLPVGELVLFFTSPNQGMVANPGNHMGNLCVTRNQLGRFVRNIVTSDANGLASMDLDPWVMPTNPNQIIAPGQTWNFQGWYRDGSVSNFTDAASITFQ